MSIRLKKQRERIWIIEQRHVLCYYRYSWRADRIKTRNVRLKCFFDIDSTKFLPVYHTYLISPGEWRHSCNQWKGTVQFRIGLAIYQQSWIVALHAGMYHACCQYSSKCIKSKSLSIYFNKFKGLFIYKSCKKNPNKHLFKMQNIPLIS